MLRWIETPLESTGKKFGFSAIMLAIITLWIALGAILSEAYSPHPPMQIFCSPIETIVFFVVMLFFTPFGTLVGLIPLWIAVWVANRADELRGLVIAGAVLLMVVLDTVSNAIGGNIVNIIMGMPTSLMFVLYYFKMGGLRQGEMSQLKATGWLVGLNAALMFLMTALVTLLMLMILAFDPSANLCEL